MLLKIGTTISVMASMIVGKGQVNDMRLGDLDALTEDVLKSFAKNDRARDVIKHIQFTPTIDAVPVVRCKDCKYRDSAHDCIHPEHIHHYYDGEGYDYESFHMVDSDHFCSYGERKAENPCDHCMSGSYRGCDGCSYGERKDGEG